MGATATTRSSPAPATTRSPAARARHAERRARRRRLPDRLEGGEGDDALIGARADTRVPFSSGKSELIGGGSDVMVGGDPCDGDVFDGGQGNDDANLFRFTPGVKVQIGGEVSCAGGPCTSGQIAPSVEEIEGSPGNDTLIASNKGDTLIGKRGRRRPLRPAAATITSPAGPATTSGRRPRARQRTPVSRASLPRPSVCGIFPLLKERDCSSTSRPTSSL